MPDAPEARNNHHAEIGIELQGDDAEGEPRVLHASLDRDRTALCNAETEQISGYPPESETEGVVGDDECEGQQDRYIQQVAFANQSDHDEKQ